MIQLRYQTKAELAARFAGIGIEQMDLANWIINQAQDAAAGDIITSSTFTLDPVVQREGSQWVNEVHSDKAGVDHYVTYLAAPGADHAAIATNRATQLATDLATQEFEALIGGG